MQVRIVSAHSKCVERPECFEEIVVAASESYSKICNDGT